MKNDIIKFGKYDWVILAAKHDRTLIITENIIAQQPYHKPGGKITWDKCTLRSYLNGEFYNSFSPADRDRIIRVTNKNQNNQWWRNVPGGEPTRDYLFLLSLEEVTEYMGDKRLLKTRGNQKYWIDDGNNEARMARYGVFFAWWWLRSPGSVDYVASNVSADGSISVNGCNVYVGSGGIRPALWISRTE